MNAEAEVDCPLHGQQPKWPVVNGLPQCHACLVAHLRANPKQLPADNVWRRAGCYRGAGRRLAREVHQELPIRCHDPQANDRR